MNKAKISKQTPQRGKATSERHSKLQKNVQGEKHADQKVLALDSNNSEPKIDGRSLRRKTGKSSNPDYASAFFWIRKSTKKEVMRKLEFSDLQMDMSDLVESLLSEWLAKTK
jgi:hypothetical protein